MWRYRAVFGKVYVAGIPTVLGGIFHAVFTITDSGGLRQGTLKYVLNNRFVRYNQYTYAIFPMTFP